MTPLNQQDFQMELVTDLGVGLPKPTSKCEVRLAVFKCNHCGKNFKTNAYRAKAQQQEHCRPCSISLGQTIRKKEGELLECTTCKELLPTSAFYTQKGTATGFRTQCKLCTLAQNKEYRENNKESIKEAKKRAYVKRNYNISLEEYNKAFESSTVCEICKRTAEETSMPTLNYDHCHTTGAFRGILCRDCNQAIGTLGDTAESLYKAYKYLQKSENSVS